MFIERDPEEIKREEEERERELRRKKKVAWRPPDVVSRELVLLVRSGEYREAQKLLKNDFTKIGGLEIQDTEGCTALMHAVKLGGNSIGATGLKCLVACKMLLRKGAMADTPDHDGIAPLHVAVQNTRAYNYYVPIVQQLLQGGVIGKTRKSPGASPEVATKADGIKPLMLAARAGQVRVITLLLQLGRAKVNATDFRKKMAIHHCLEEIKKDGRTRAAKLEIKAGEAENYKREKLKRAVKKKVNKAKTKLKMVRHLTQAKEIREGEEAEADAVEKTKAAEKKRRRQARKQEAKRKRRIAVAAGEDPDEVKTEDDTDEDANKEVEAGQVKDGDLGAEVETGDGNGEGENASTETKAKGKDGTRSTEPEEETFDEFEEIQNDALTDNTDSGPSEDTIVDRHINVLQRLLAGGADMGLGNYDVGMLTTPLHYACRFRQLEVARVLLEFAVLDRNRHVIDMRDAFGNTPLHWTVKAGPGYSQFSTAYSGSHYLCSDESLEKVFGAYMDDVQDGLGGKAGLRAMLDMKADERRAWEGRTRLHMETLVGELVATPVNADPDVGDDEGFGPLHTACDMRYHKVAMQLLQASADPTAQTVQRGVTPLHLACEHQDESLVRLLLVKRHGLPVIDADTGVPEVEDDGVTVVRTELTLHESEFAKREDERIVAGYFRSRKYRRQQRAQRRGVSFPSPTAGDDGYDERKDRNSPFYEVVKSEIVDDKDHRGWTALHICLDQCRKKPTRGHGEADLVGAPQSEDEEQDDSDEDGDDEDDGDDNENHDDSGRVIEAWGNDDTGKVVAVTVATPSANAHFSKRKTGAGTDKDSASTEARASRRRRHGLSLARLLLEAGADWRGGHADMGHDCSALHVAAADGDVAVVQLLVEFGADAAVTGVLELNPWRPLHLAARAGSPGLVAMLLCESGVELDARDFRGRTAREIAELRAEKSSNHAACVSAIDRRINSCKKFLQAVETAESLVFKRDYEAATNAFEAAYLAAGEPDQRGRSEEQGACCMRASVAWAHVRDAVPKPGRRKPSAHHYEAHSMSSSSSGSNDCEIVVATSRSTGDSGHRQLMCEEEIHEREQQAAEEAAYIAEVREFEHRRGQIAEKCVMWAKRAKCYEQLAKALELANKHMEANKARKDAKKIRQLRRGLKEEEMQEKAKEVDHDLDGSESEYSSEYSCSSDSNDDDEAGSKGDGADSEVDQSRDKLLRGTKIKKKRKRKNVAGGDADNANAAADGGNDIKSVRSVKGATRATSNRQDSDAEAVELKPATDWICTCCHKPNTPKLEACHVCGKDRPDVGAAKRAKAEAAAERGEGSDAPGDSPGEAASVHGTKRTKDSLNDDELLEDTPDTSLLDTALMNKLRRAAGVFDEDENDGDNGDHDRRKKSLMRLVAVQVTHERVEKLAKTLDLDNKRDHTKSSLTPTRKAKGQQKRRKKRSKADYIKMKMKKELRLEVEDLDEFDTDVSPAGNVPKDLPDGHAPNQTGIDQKKMLSQTMFLVDPDATTVANGGVSPALRKLLLVGGDGGNIYSWGDNRCGQLGLGEDYNGDGRSMIGGRAMSAGRPQAVSTFLDKEVVAVACGKAHSIIVTHKNEVFSCGSNINGELGLGVEYGGLIDQTGPQPLHSLRNQVVTMISCGLHHSIIVTHHNSSSNSARHKRRTDMMAAEATGGVGNVFAGEEVKGGGDGHWILAWGLNSGGECGLGHTRSPIRAPTRLLLPPPPGAPPEVSRMHATAVVELVRRQQQVEAELLNDGGLGKHHKHKHKHHHHDSNQPESEDHHHHHHHHYHYRVKDYTPPRCARLACGAHHTLVTTGDGHVLTWGSNKYGQLGLDKRRTPNFANPQPVTAFHGAGHDVSAAEFKAAHARFAKSEQNPATTEEEHAAAREAEKRRRHALIKTANARRMPIVALACGAFSSMVVVGVLPGSALQALVLDEGVDEAGVHVEGLQEDRTARRKRKERQQKRLRDKAAHKKQGAGWQRKTAVVMNQVSVESSSDDDGSSGDEDEDEEDKDMESALWAREHCSEVYFAFGRNNYGQLGLGDVSYDDHATVDVYSPRVSRFFLGRGGGIRCVDSGSAHTVIVTSDGRTWSMGLNAYGECGLGHSASVTVPSRVEAVEQCNIIQVVCGHHHTLFLTAAQGIWSCGWDHRGQCGRGGGLRFSGTAVGSGSNVVDIDDVDVEDDIADGLGAASAAADVTTGRDGIQTGSVSEARRTALRQIRVLGNSPSIRLATATGSAHSCMHMSKCGNIPLLVTLLRKGNLDLRSKAQVVGALCRHAVDDDNCERITAAGCLPLLSELVECHERETELEAVTLVARLVKSRGSVQLAVRRAGLLVAVVPLLLNAVTQDATTQAAAVVGHMTKGRGAGLHVRSRQLLREAGGIPPLCALLDNPHAGPRTHAAVARALCNLSTEDYASRVAIREAGGLKPLCKYYWEREQRFPPSGWEDEALEKRMSTLLDLPSGGSNSSEED